MEEEARQFMFMSVYLLHRKRKNKQEEEKRKWWVRPWISKRFQHGAYRLLLNFGAGNTVVIGYSTMLLHMYLKQCVYGVLNVVLCGYTPALCPVRCKM